MTSQNHGNGWTDTGNWSPSDSWDDPWNTMDSTPPTPNQFELRNEDEQNPWRNSSQAQVVNKKQKYSDGDTIDWLTEEAAERTRQHHLQSLRGLRGLLMPILDSSRMWFISIATGIGVGIIGAWLDVWVRWLSDLREGRCSYGFFYNEVACCSGLDPGEECTGWSTWSDWFHIDSSFGRSFLQATIYIVLAIGFSASAGVLVKTYAPYAFHTGIPEIKAILGGFVFDEFLGPWVLLIKSLGLALAVASGLSLGKEGPLVHVACSMAFVISKAFKGTQQNEAQKRRILASAAAAGIAVAFGSPLGGVLFGLEELDTFADDSDVIWRGFVTSVVAAVSLQYIDPFGTSKLVLFQVTGITGVSDTWRAFELVPWLFLGVIGGILGAMMIKLNVAAAVYRERSSFLRENPLTEVIGFTAITTAISFLIVFQREQTSELVAALFQECDPTKIDFHGLCNPNALVENMFLLVLTAGIKIGLTAWTFGMMVPAGIFLPTIAIGACLGRAVGLIAQGLYRAYPKAWIFSSCPPDPSVRCISTGFYAVIGASAMLGGVTRMTISLVVILFELTGALSHVLPIMLSVMVSKWVGDAFGKEGIYASWIALRKYPWLPPAEYKDKGETAANVMVPAEKLVLVKANCTIEELAQTIKEHTFHGYPVVTEDMILLGFVIRDKIRDTLDSLVNTESLEPMSARRVTFSRNSDTDVTNLSSLLEVPAMQLKKEVPQELVVGTFQKLNMRYIFFTEQGKLTGLVTRSDVVALMTAHVPHAGALSTRPEVIWEDS